jgi:hypothetical protein
MPRMNRLTSLLCCLLTLCLASPSLARESAPATTPVATDAQTQWLTVLLAGRKVGHMRIDREFDGDTVVTRQFMTFEMGRAGIAVVMSTEEEHTETRDGQPLAYSSVSTISGLQMRTEGRRIEGDRFAVKSGAANAMRESELTWPDGALMTWGLEQKMRTLDLSPGSSGSFSLFQPMLGQAIEVEYQVVGPATVSLPDGTVELIETRQVMRMPGGEIVSRGWMDAQMNMRRSIMDVMGEELELLACSQTCAEAPNQPAEILTTSLVRAPRPLETTELGRPLVLEIESEVALADWPGIDGQRLFDLGKGRYRIETLTDSPDPVAPPAERDVQRTDWLDFDTDSVRELIDGKAPEGDNVTRMQALQDLVNAHIKSKSLNIGYASAGDAARLREGDCTEHALLLTALARSLGIPARVVNGLAYTGDFEGNKAVFVPHAWVAAWTGDRWQAFDAALPGRQLRLALFADNGDPWRFYSGIEAFGKIRITAISSGGE